MNKKQLIILVAFVFFAHKQQNIYGIDGDNNRALIQAYKNRVVSLAKKHDPQKLQSSLNALLNTTHETQKQSLQAGINQGIQFMSEQQTNAEERKIFLEKWGFTYPAYVVYLTGKLTEMIGKATIILCSWNNFLRRLYKTNNQPAQVYVESLEAKIDAIRKAVETRRKNSETGFKACIGFILWYLGYKIAEYAHPYAYSDLHLNNISQTITTMNQFKDAHFNNEDNQN